MNPIPSFAASYAEARGKFLAAAAARGAVVESHEHPEASGAHGETLALDVARLGAGTDSVLMITSGTHGVEGFCGSGAQVALLDDDDFVRMAEASGAAVVLVHAVNPWGFSHLRRANEDNVDVNRNFRDFAAPRVPDSAYAEVHPFMSCADWPPSPENERRMADYVARRGARALQAAVTAGQTDFPDGMFFAGRRASWSNQVLRGVLRGHAACARRLCWIDVHTGLGPYGHGEKIHAGPPDASVLARTVSTFGADVTSVHDGTSTSARVEGVIFLALADECPRVECTAIALEFGTVPLAVTLQALRAEQWLRRHPDAPKATRASIDRALREAFQPDGDDWKGMVYGQARGAAIQALRTLGLRGATVLAGA